MTFLELWFEKNFQSNDKFAFLFPGQIYITKFSFPKRSSDLKIVQTPPGSG